MQFVLFAPFSFWYLITATGIPNLSLRIDARYSGLDILLQIRISRTVCNKTDFSSACLIYGVYFFAAIMNIFSTRIFFCLNNSKIVLILAQSKKIPSSNIFWLFHSWYEWKARIISWSSKFEEKIVTFRSDIRIRTVSERKITINPRDIKFRSL